MRAVVSRWTRAVTIVLQNVHDSVTIQGGSIVN